MVRSLSRHGVPKPFAVLSVLLLVLYMVAGGLGATAASAHTAAVTADCDALDVTLTRYDTSGNNRVTVTINETTVADETFSSGYAETFAAPDRSKAYTYRVVVVANDGAQYSLDRSGTSEPCKEPGNGHIPVNVCHATNSDTNPYVFITPDASSTKFQGHLAHRDTPNKTWKSATVFNGVLYPAGSAKRDFIGSYTDRDNQFHQLDGTVTEAFCKGAGTQPVVPSGDLRAACVENSGKVATENLSKGSFSAVQWRLVTGTPENHSTVLASGAGTDTIAATGLADGTRVWLQYRTGTEGTWTDEGSTVVTGSCAPPPGPTCEQLATDRTQFVYTVNGVTYTYSGFISFPTTMTSATVALKQGVVVPAGCQIPFSLAMYETDGPTWPTSGTQEFLGHDTDVITSTVSSITLTVPSPGCFGQSDLYTGTTKYDGVANPVPHYPNPSVPTAAELIGAWNGQNGTCKPKAQVRKVTDPVGKEAGWSFTLTRPGGGTTTLTTAAGGLSQAVDLTELGTYTITEVARQGWENGPWKIEKNGSTVQTCTFTVTNFLRDRDTVFGCTFYNRELAELVVDKKTLPAGAEQSFAFRATGPGEFGRSFALTDAATPWSSGKVTAGAYSVVEETTAGWRLKTSSCTDQSSPGTVVLSPGEKVTCTFTNAQLGAIVVDKVTRPAGSPESFDFTVEGPGAADEFSLTHAATPHPTGSLVPGTYTVTEDDEDGWVLSRLSCPGADADVDLDEGSAEVTVAPGQTVTCTFTNTASATLTVKKVARPADTDQLFRFTGPFGQGGLTLGAGDSEVFELPPGDYDLAEVVPEGWVLDDLTCVVDGDDEGDSEELLARSQTVEDGDDPPANGTTVDLDAGDHAVCTFTNVALGAIVVKKVATGATSGDAGETFTFTGDAAGSISLPIAADEQIVVDDLMPGTYTSRELATAGWVLKGIVCDDSASASPSTTTAATATATFKVDPGETVVCTFTNVKPVLTKTASPPTSDATPTLVPRSSTITYTVRVENPGSRAISSAPLVDSLPANVSDPFAVTAVQGSWDSYAYDPAGNGTITWVVSLAAGETKVFTYQVTVDPTAPSGGDLLNRVTFQDLEGSTLHRVGVPVPTLDKSSPDEGAVVPLGSTVHYKVTVANTGNLPITGRPVVDTLPDGVTYVPGSATSASTGGATVSASPTASVAAGHNTLTWTVTLPAGASATVEFDVTVDPSNPRAAELRNTATFENLTDSTVHTVGIPGPTLDKFSSPATTDASPTLVQPGTRIDYSVRVGNTGNLPITNAPVVDTLPANVTAVAGSVSDGGTVSADGKTITWTVSLAPAATKTFTYAVTVDQAAPEGALLVNSARFQGLLDTTTHVVPTGDLTLVKGVSPVAGNGVVVEFGDTLTYTLTVTATGSLTQPSVVVSDYVPGSDPARPGSGATTYVPRSATCVGAGPCTVTEPGSDGLISWALGDMAAGTTRQVTFQVVIDEVDGDPGETVIADILNAGAVQSTLTRPTPSNEVVTPVTEVFPVKVGNPPAGEEPGVLPRTGSPAPIGALVTAGIALLAFGLVLHAASGRRAPARRGGTAG